MDAQDKQSDNQDRAVPPAKPAHSALWRLYDKIPVTLKQVDRLLIALIVLIVTLLIYGIIKGNT